MGGFNHIFWLLLLALVLTSALFALQVYLRRSRAAVARRLKSKDVMVPISGLIQFKHGDQGHTILKVALCSFQPYFPVCHLGSVAGFLSREDLIKAVALGEECYLSELMDRHPDEVDAESPLGPVLELFENGAQMVVVKSGSECVGIIVRDLLFELLAVQGVALKSKFPQGIFDNKS